MMDLRSALRAEIVLRERMAAAIPLPATAHEILLLVALARVEGRRLNVTGAAVGPYATCQRHMDLLEEAGLVRREPSRDDRRMVWLHITDEGFARVSALFGVPALARVA